MQVKIVKLIILFVMAFRGHCAKKKKDAFNNLKEELKEPKVDAEMDFQPNMFVTKSPKSKLQGLHCSTPTLLLNGSLKLQHTRHQLRH